MSTNPFLVDSSCVQPSSTVPAFNPFAVFAADATDSSSASNPFLHSFGATETGDLSGNNDATFIQPLASTAPNPFAQFFSTGDPNISEKTAPESIVTDNFLLDNNYDATTTMPVENAAHSQMEPPPAAAAPLGPPRRPPPPRPSVAKETKDLILSVTGALEATSSDLLDRLQATRTPSPTPLRELNSPSPTAMYEVNDLLGDDDIAPPPAHHHGAAVSASSDIQKEASDIFDAIANLAKTEVQPAATMAPSTVPFSMVPTSMVPPVPPPAPVPPPSRPPPPQLPIQSVETDLSSLLDSRLAVNRTSEVAAVNSTVGHLAAGGPRSKTELGVYTATRKASHDITATRLQSVPARKKYSLDYSATIGGSAPLVDPNAIRQGTAPSPVIEDSAPPVPSSLPTNEFSTTVPPPLTMQSPSKPKQSLPSPPPPPPPSLPPIDVERDRSDGGDILETAKFPIMSTTPLMSYENIANENLYEDAQIVPAPAPAQDVFAPGTSTLSGAFDNDPFASAPLVATNLSFTAAPTTANMDVGADFGMSSCTDFGVSSTTGVDDEFDDFDQKFRNFSKNDMKTGAAADPFDPFSNTGGMAAANGQSDRQGINIYLLYFLCL